MPDSVEVLAPSRVLARAARSLRSPTPVFAPALAPDRLERSVGAAHEVEVVDHDPRPGKHRPNRLAVGLVGVDRDDLDRQPLLL